MASVPHEHFSGITSYHALAEKKREQRLSTTTVAATAQQKTSLADVPRRHSKVATWTRRGVIATLGGALATVAAYDVASIPALLDLAEKEKGQREAKEMQRKIVEKMATAMKMIQQEFARAESTQDLESVHKIRERLEIVIQEYRSNGTPYEETARACALAARACELLGDLQGAVGHYSYAVMYASNAEREIPEASEWNAKCTKLLAELPPPVYEPLTTEQTEEAQRIFAQQFSQR